MVPVLPCESPFTGLFSAASALEEYPGDPEIISWGATLPPSPGSLEPVNIGGAGLDNRSAWLACMGEGLERYRAHPLESDARLLAKRADWKLDEAALPTDTWVLFHREQYTLPGFPFAPLSEDTECSWCRFRDSATGEPVWVPEDLGYLFSRPGESHRVSPGTSTGLVAGTAGQPLLLRGVQECIERDAIVGAWWESYPVFEYKASEVFSAFGDAFTGRVRRPHLAYRFYRLASPFSDHVTLVTLEGSDGSRDLFSAGAACRETLVDSLKKALIEAAQGRMFVRYLVENGALPNELRCPTNFAEHAAHYTIHPERRSQTVLHRAARSESFIEANARPSGSLALFRSRLGPERPILVRNMTPPYVAQTMPEWSVLRVLVPGLQPLHGHHQLPHLGGTLWGAHTIGEYEKILPHPMP